MKKIYVIRKFILASSVQEAIKKEKNAVIDDCFANEDQHREFLMDLQKKTVAGFKAKKKE